MKPLQHARITAHRYGGQWQDWIALHDWIDRSKMLFPSMQHRMFLHSDFGEWLTIQIHGELFEAADSMVVATRELFRDHQVEDVGRAVPLAEWLREIDEPYWQRRRPPPRCLESIREAPAQGLAARWGGVPEDYQPLLAFFDMPRAFAPEQAEAADLITHNSFGIFLAEELLGTTLLLSAVGASPSSFISTRSAAEDLAYARLGFIPAAGNLAARTRLKRWMCGSEVVGALRVRQHRASLPSKIVRGISESTQ